MLCRRRCQDGVHRGGDIDRVDVRGRGAPALVDAAGRSDQDGAAACSGSGLDVAVGITHHPGCAEIDVELHRRVDQHARGRLATPARLPELWHRRLGMVETAPNRIENNSFVPQQIEHAPLDGEQLLEWDDALRGRRLVRDRDEQIARIAKAAESRGCAGNESNVVGIEG
jgi:hypothetical protein